MKKLLCLMLALVLTLSTSMAMADTVINPTEKRNIKLQPVGENEVEEGISPTTGLDLSTMTAPEGFTGLAATGRYTPMMVQIGNDDGGVGRNAPWGTEYVDIVYEIPLHKNGGTRLSFIFSDLIPDRVGPIRSARLAHVWLREEWGAGFIYFGQQLYKQTNVNEEIANLGHSATNNKATDLFYNMLNGGKAWSDMGYRREEKGFSRPNNVTVSASAVSTIVPADYVAPNHAFKFTDDTPDGDLAMNITVSWHSGDGDQKAGSLLTYDIDSNTYLRFMRTSSKGEPEPWVDHDTGVQPAFSNIIVQFTTTEYKGNDAPVTHMIEKSGKNYSSAEGNADFFMCGVHIAGYWKRDSVTSRTVYYGPDGNEIELQRGKTLILVMPSNESETGSKISYE